MVFSMTGFGRGVVKEKGVRYTVEARSVNNRYCEVRVQAPKEMLELEHQLAKKVRETFARGKFDLLLKIEHPASADRDFDEKALIDRWHKLERLRKKLKLDEPVDLETVLEGAPRSYVSGVPEDGAKHLERAAVLAMEKLKDARRKEGEALVRDIVDRAKTVQKAVDRLEKQVVAGRDVRFQKMRGRLEEILKDRPVDDTRLEMEMALLVEKGDVTEEIVRLRSHVSRLASALKGKGSVGRELDFLLQEMNREINTIGSKTADLDVTADVVLVKAEIERIREQVQNLE